MRLVFYDRFTAGIMEKRRTYPLGKYGEIIGYSGAE